MPDSEATTCTPQGRIGTSTTSSSLDVADRAGERQPDRVALGDLERLEDDLVDAVVLELERPGKDLVAPAGVDREPKRELARDAGVMDLRDEPRLVALRERAGTLRSTKKFLRTVKRRGRLAGQRVGAGDAPRRDAVLRQGRRGLEA